MILLTLCIASVCTPHQISAFSYAGTGYSFFYVEGMEHQCDGVSSFSFNGAVFVTAATCKSEIFEDGFDK